jgi:hypothetical protein
MAVILKIPRILSLRRAKNPRHGILIYSNLQSRSRGTRVIHTVTGAKRGRKIRFHCSCEIASFHPQVPCIHVLAVQARLRKAARGCSTGIVENEQQSEKGKGNGQQASRQTRHSVKSQTVEVNVQHQCKSLRQGRLNPLSSVSRLGQR